MLTLTLRNLERDGILITVPRSPTRAPPTSAPPPRSGPAEKVNAAVPGDVLGR
jgi:hypothetical protein